MKKLLLTLTAALGTMFCASAVNPFLEFQPLQDGGDLTAFNVQAGVTGKVHNNFRLGAGIGITEHWNFSEDPLIPIFVRGQIEGPVGEFNPFFSFDVGYEINTEDTGSGAVLVNPMIGLQFGKWYGGIGYLGHCWTGDGSGTTGCFNMKIGYNF